MEIEFDRFLGHPQGFFLGFAKTGDGKIQTLRDVIRILASEGVADLSHVCKNRVARTVASGRVSPLARRRMISSRAVVRKTGNHSRRDAHSTACGETRQPLFPEKLALGIWAETFRMR